MIEGIGRTGRLVTCAALILFLAFAALASGPGTDLKTLATGLGIGILLDATIVRSLLVPSLVSLFGRWNWYLPAGFARMLRVEPSHAAPGTGASARPNRSRLPLTLPTDRSVGRVARMAELPGVDLAALTRWLDAERPGLRTGELSGEVIAGGKSNLTYRITDGTSTWALRRPPLAHVLPTAHDMAREYTVISALGADRRAGARDRRAVHRPGRARRDRST